MVCLFNKILHYFKVYSQLIGIKINLEKSKVYLVFFSNDIFWIEIVKTLSILDIFTDSTKKWDNSWRHILFILYLS